MNSTLMLALQLFQLNVEMLANQMHRKEEHSWILRKVMIET